MEIKGTYATAKVFTDEIEKASEKQIEQLCSQEIFANSRIRIMPDCHAGKGCVIGFTANLKDKVVPNLVGVDISCSISTYKIDSKNVDLSKLDDFVRYNIPHGEAVRKTVSEIIPDSLIDRVSKVSDTISTNKAFIDRDLRSMGSLGSGNHFLELNKDKDGTLWFSIHCGSRNFGHRICQFYQKRSIAGDGIPRDLQYIEGDDLKCYCEHVKVAQDFAKMNHEVILHEISSFMGWNILDTIFTNHNYIEFLGNGEMLIRKGAISAKQGERLIIPMNMRDGSLIGIGKGNIEWNSSSPHGAGRVLSRMKAFETLSFEEFKNQMNGVFSTCVTKYTLDESPMAYKKMEAITKYIGESVEITDRIIPIYNFKAT